MARRRALDLAVDLVEMLGADTIIHGKIEGPGRAFSRACRAPRA